MEIDKVSVIGLGSVGSFFTKSLSLCDKIKKFILVDSDIVEEKNLRNTIYRKKDIGKYKVDATSEIISNLNPDIEIEKIKQPYTGTNNYNSNFIVDCRDVISEKNDNIDCKLSVSDRSLIMDCRKNVTNVKERLGFYISKVTKNDLQSVTSKVVSLIEHPMFDIFLKNQIVHIINMNDSINKIVTETQRSRNNNNLVYENFNQLNKKIYGFESLVTYLLLKNKDYNITIYRSDKPDIFVTLEQNSIKDIQNLSNSINSIVDANYNFFVNFLDKKVELIPEIGAA